MTYFAMVDAIYQPQSHPIPKFQWDGTEPVNGISPCFLASSRVRKILNVTGYH